MSGKRINRTAPSVGRGLIVTGAVGVILAALCCATPILAVVLAAIGVSSWLAGADFILLPVLLAGVALIGLGFYRRKTARLRRDTRHF